MMQMIEIDLNNKRLEAAEKKHLNATLHNEKSLYEVEFEDNFVN